MRGRALERPACAGAMRIAAFVTARKAVRRILVHLDRRDIDARAGPSTICGQRGEISRGAV